MISGMITRIERVEDRQFMADLYDKFKRLMFYIAKKWTEVPSEQDDIVQDAVEKLIGKIDLLKSMDEGRRVNYISHTIRNTAIKHLDKKSRDNRLLINLELSTIGDATTDGSSPVEKHLIQQEWKKEFAKIWSELPERERLLLEGKYIFHESNEDIASWMNCKPSSVRMALTRARRKILEELIRREHDAEPETATGTI